MALTVKSRDYLDHLGRSIGFPIANQGDFGTYKVKYSVFWGVILSQNNPVQFIGGADSVIKLSVGTFEELGIVSGDTVTIDITSIDGGSTFSGTGTILLVNGNEMTLDSTSPLNFSSMNGYIYVNKSPQAVEIEFNLVPSTQQDGFE